MLTEVIICPVCLMPTGFYAWPSAADFAIMEYYAYPLYQRSYVGEEEYISVRCSGCFDIAIKEDT